MSYNPCSVITLEVLLRLISAWGHNQLTVPASLCKSISKALLDDPSPVKHLNETDEDVLYACRHTYGKSSILEICMQYQQGPGTSANLVVYRVDTVLNRLLQLQPALIHEKLDGLKCKHVAKRDKQKFLQFSYKERAWQSSKKVQKQRHQYWTRACERKAAGEAEVLDAIENMRNACFESMGEWSDREDAPSSSSSEFEVW